MKLLLQMIGIFLSLAGVILYYLLYRYIKQHKNEELELHESYISSRLTAFFVLEIIGAILNVIVVFLP